MLMVEGFQKFAGIAFGISRICDSLMPQRDNDKCQGLQKSLNPGWI